MSVLSKPKATQRRRIAKAQPSLQSPTARDVARQAAYCARGWAAPRLSRAGSALEDRVAPRISSVMYRTARRIEPPRPSSRRRWPYVAAGLIMAGGVTGAVLWQRRRRSSRWPQAEPEPQEAQPAAASTARNTSRADANGRVPVS